jgi:hypothetical protein
MSNDVTGSIYNIYSQANVASGASLTNLYSVYIGASGLNSSTVTNVYGLYQAGASEKNYFAGKVGIGIESPTNQLHLKHADGPTIQLTRTSTQASSGNIGDIVFGNNDWDSSMARIGARQDGTNDGARLEFSTQSTAAGGELVRMIIHRDGQLKLGYQSIGGSVGTAGVILSDGGRNSSLGTTLGDTQRVVQFHNLSQNQDYLTFRTRRITDGQSGWNHSAWDITRDIDNTSDVYRYMTFGIGDVVINDFGANMDFRVESNTNANMLFVDGGTNRVGIGDGTPTHTLDVNGVLGLKGNAFLDSDGSSHYIKANTHLYFYPSSTGTCTIQSTGFHPMNDNAVDLGTTAKRWRNLYTTDLHLSNEGKPEGNEVDGTTGNWTIQEGDENLYILNNKTGKKYKFALEEIT